MKVNVGCDIVKISRFANMDKKVLRKLFHKKELQNAEAENLAGLFAAKESCKKIINDLSWHDIEIIKKRNGKPTLLLQDKSDIEDIDVSISHDGEYAMATVVFLRKDGS